MTWSRSVDGMIADFSLNTHPTDTREMHLLAVDDSGLEYSKMNECIICSRPVGTKCLIGVILIFA